MTRPGYEILYHGRVVDKDIPNLDKTIKEQTRQAIENKLGQEPEVYGLPLRGTLKKYWKLRVGDYRVVYEIVGTKVIVLLIAHRRNVYRNAARRIGS